MGGFSYKPEGDVLKAFMRDNGFFRGIRGPVGSGKSVGSEVEIYRRANEQAPSTLDGIRKTRWAVIRNTYPQLKTTTVKTWLAWYKEADFGKFNWSVPYTHHIRTADIDCEVIFIALDREEDVRKLLSLDLTGAFINEAREVRKSIVDAVTMRVGRYPSMHEGGPTWYGVWCDTNAPEDDHWWPIMAGEAPIPDYLPEEERLMLIKPDDWNFYTQPPGMLEDKDERGNVIGYRENPEAENVRNLPKEYYKRIITGKKKSWIDVYVMNRLGTIEDGKPVYPMFRPEVHVSKEPLVHLPGLPVYIGVDFGRTPAAVFGQRMPDGSWQIFHELVVTDMGVTRFGEALRHEIHRQMGNDFYELTVTGDPSGEFGSDRDETNCYALLKATGVTAYPAYTNDRILRIECVETQLNKMVDGRPAFLVSPTCRVLVKGFSSGYQYRRIQSSGASRTEEKPDKTGPGAKYSHPHDALQYLFLGAGEGRKLTRGNREAKIGNTRAQTHVLDRLRNKRKRSRRRSSL